MSTWLITHIWEDFLPHLTKLSANTSAQSWVLPLLPGGQLSWTLPWRGATCLSWVPLQEIQWTSSSSVCSHISAFSELVYNILHTTYITAGWLEEEDNSKCICALSHAPSGPSGEFMDRGVLLKKTGRTQSPLATDNTDAEQGMIGLLTTFSLLFLLEKYLQVVCQASGFLPVKENMQVDSTFLKCTVQTQTSPRAMVCLTSENGHEAAAFTCPLFPHCEPLGLLRDPRPWCLLGFPPQLPGDSSNTPRSFWQAHVGLRGSWIGPTGTAPSLFPERQCLWPLVIGNLESPAHFQT